jgi:hypothetical protein
MMREANARGELPRLSECELAFYEAPQTSDSVVKVLGATRGRDRGRAGRDSPEKYPHRLNVTRECSGATAS